jgi:glycosyltransferase involved in cell wall biosynthesis
VTTEVTRVAVVVPAHNEELLIGRCLEGLQSAVQMVGVPARIVVVLDGCTDGTGDVCERYGVEVRRIQAGNVGQARAAGARWLLRHESDPASVWLATTDADTRVDPTWLHHQIELARGGADVVLGIVALHDDGPRHLRLPFEADYQKLMSADGSHGHVHGANFGIRASAYLRSGGFPPVPNHEDRLLVQRLEGMAGVTITRSQLLTVQTSGRVHGRCRHGFAASLAALDAPRLAGSEGQPSIPVDLAPKR